MSFSNLCRLKRLLVGFTFALFVFRIANLYSQPTNPVFDYGLAFTSHEATKDLRTSLELSPSRPIPVDQDFSIDFDIQFRRQRESFGYILRIIGNDSINFDLISGPDHSGFYDLDLIANNTAIPLDYKIENETWLPGQWNHVKVSISFETNQVSISWNGQKKSTPCAVQGLKYFRFFFGGNDFAKYNTTDVPPMILKNIEISTKRKLLYAWDLKKHAGNTVYDSLHNLPATAKNPIWIADQHAHWKLRDKVLVGKFPNVAFDDSTGRLFVCDDRSVNILDLSSGEKTTFQNGSGSVFRTDANQLIYVGSKSGLYNYDVASNSMSAYDFDKKSWENRDTIPFEPSHAHSNKFYSPSDSAVYTFGGYGFYEYSNDFYKYDFTTGNWRGVKTTGAVIPPRYLSAAGLNDTKTKALIFGGYGSESGKQEVSPQSFNDLYTFDLKSKVVTKVKGDVDFEVAPNTVFSNSLVINEKDSCFYVLAYPRNKYKGYIKLFSYSLATPVGRHRQLGDSILFLFHDVTSFCDLFYHEEGKNLIAVTSHKVGEQYEVQVYSIKNPPLRPDDIIQRPPKESVLSKIILFGGLAALLMAALAGIILKYRKRKKRIPAPADTGFEEYEIPPAVDDTGETSTIDLFGGLHVVDKQGNDITQKFTATLKELFIFIILNSVKFEKGVSTGMLQEVLWPDKDEVSARNNRNVNLNKLRNLLHEIGDIGIENSNSYIRLLFHESVSCDYQIACNILRQSPMDAQKIEMLLKCVRKGSLLPNVQAIWLDSFKSEISNKIIDALSDYAFKLDVERDDKLLLDIADSIFHYDTINEEAMIIKCSVLIKKGKHSLARDWYSHFAKEYRNLYGEIYPKTFEEVISPPIS